MKRLFDDPALPFDLRAELREDLQRSRRAGADYDALAKLPLLHSALSDASLQPGATPTSASERMLDARRPSWPRLHVAPWTWKLALLVTVGGASMLAAWPAQREPRLSQSALTQQPTDAPAMQPPPSAREVEAPAKTSTPAGTAEPVGAPTLTLVDEPAPVALAAPVARPSARSSRREIAQLQRIRALLERDPTAAYRLAQRSEQEYPHGLLSEERQALQVLALAKTGATEAAARKAQQFFARYPESPMRERLESALKK
jgi:hypothetical protein